jgi:hypothetical protein
VHAGETEEASMAKQEEPVTREVHSVTAEYVGTKPFGREFVGRRTITKKQFADIGIDSETIEFSAANNWKQSIAPENEALVEYFDKTDSGFKVHTV